jgi:RimJ/RimL family protein N-acetyltransferase
MVSEGNPSTSPECLSGDGLQLRSRRLMYRPFEGQDVSPDYLETLSDPSYMRFSRQRTVVHTVESALEYMRDLRASQGQLIAAVDQVAERVVATVSVRPWADKAPAEGAETHAEVGLMTLKNFSGKGFGTEAWGAVVARLREDGMAEWLWAGADEQNIAMRHIIVNSGFTLVDGCPPWISPSQAPNRHNVYYKLSLTS